MLPHPQIKLTVKQMMTIMSPAQPLPAMCTSTPVKSTQCSRIQVGPTLCERFTQTPVQLDETPKLKDTICSLRSKVDDYKQQLSQFQELRSNFTHLSTAYRELSDRNCLLEAEIASLKAEQQFQTPRKSAKQVPIPTTPVQTTNKFDVLAVSPPTDSHANCPAATNSPKSASKMEHVEPPSSKPTIKSPPHQPRPEIRAPPAEPKPSQILIFSNSICKRIDASRFYRGRTTKLYAESGATVAQIQRQVENCEDEDSKHVILQA